jgi:hypothetical protein
MWSEGFSNEGPSFFGLRRLGSTYIRVKTNTFILLLMVCASSSIFLHRMLGAVFRFFSSWQWGDHKV